MLAVEKITFTYKLHVAIKLLALTEYIIKPRKQDIYV